MHGQSFIFPADSRHPVTRASQYTLVKVRALAVLSHRKKKPIFPMSLVTLELLGNLNFPWIREQATLGAWHCLCKLSRSSRVVGAVGEPCVVACSPALVVWRDQALLGSSQLLREGYWQTRGSDVSQGLMFPRAESFFLFEHFSVLCFSSPDNETCSLESRGILNPSCLMGRLGMLKKRQTWLPKSSTLRDQAP